MNDLINFSIVMFCVSGASCVVSHILKVDQKQWRRIFVSSTLLTWLSFFISALWGKI